MYDRTLTISDVTLYLVKFRERSGFQCGKWHQKIILRAGGVNFCYFIKIKRIIFTDSMHCDIYENVTYCSILGKPQ